MSKCKTTLEKITYIYIEDDNLDTTINKILEIIIEDL